MALFGKTLLWVETGIEADFEPCRFGCVPASVRSTPLPKFIKLAGVIGVTPFELPAVGIGGGGMRWLRSTGLGVDVVDTVRPDCRVLTTEFDPE